MRRWIPFALFFATLLVSGCGYDAPNVPASDAGQKTEDLGLLRTCGNGELEDYELCDGDLFAEGQTCESQGYTGGSPTCVVWSCRPDFATCEGAVCGDYRVDEPEECDERFEGTLCEVYGAPSEPICGAECVFVPCVEQFCGDGRAHPSEECDPALDEDWCSAWGYTGGPGTCRVDCTLDVSTCGEGGFCGNGFTDDGEQCDEGTDNRDACPPGSRSCELCRTDCTFGAGRVIRCGDGIWDRGEVCEPGMVLFDRSFCEGGRNYTACGSACNWQCNEPVPEVASIIIERLQRAPPEGLALEGLSEPVPGGGSPDEPDAGATQDTSAADVTGDVGSEDAPDEEATVADDAARTDTTTNDRAVEPESSDRGGCSATPSKSRAPVLALLIAACLVSRRRKK